MQNLVKPMGIKLAPQERERLKHLGEIKQRSAHWLAKEAISQYLEREEAAENLRKETIAAWEEYQKTGEYLSHEDVAAWLETWGTDQEQKCPPFRKN
jgi:predicted transcriptional regulator